MTTLCLRNRQRTRLVDLRLLRRLTASLLSDTLALPTFELGIHLVEPAEMACINETFLQHTGSTDVITFPHDGNDARHLHGELFISVADAVAQAREFRTTWQTELARYVVHGLLHLRGYDDLTSAARRKMKREEGRIVRLLGRQFTLSKLARTPKVRR
jgi:probable rRNA maturation factor